MTLRRASSSAAAPDWLCRLAAVVAALAAALAADASWAADPRIPAVDPFDVLPEQSTRAQLYVSAREFRRLLSLQPPITVIDVRRRDYARHGGPVGVAAAVVPFKLLPGADGAPAVRNPRFLPAVRRLLAVRGLRPGATLVLVCDLGVHAAAAADYLHDHAVANAYVLVGGIAALREADAQLTAQRRP